TFKVEGHQLDEKDPEDGRAIWTSCVKWLGTSDRTARDVLEDQAEARKVKTPRDDAKAWLEARLEKETAPVPSPLVKKGGEAAGFKEGTLKGAAKDLGVVTTYEGKETLWSLEEPAF